VSAFLAAAAWGAGRLGNLGPPPAGPVSLNAVAGGGIRLLATGTGIADSLDGQPILSVASPPGLAVGQTITGSVTITNTSGGPETVTVLQTALSSPSPDLASIARLTLYDEALDGTLFQGTVSNFWTSAHALCGSSGGSCPAWVAGEAHTFDFTVVIPDGPGVDAYQGSSFTTTFEWAGSA
jgi:hypothetical protein